MYRKILGDFGELFILYWLSKRNHEPVLIDYTGIDILSLNKNTGKSWGISVKSRIRAENKEKSSINVRAKQIPLIKEACKFINDGDPVTLDILMKIEVHFAWLSTFNNYK